MVSGPLPPRGLDGSSPSKLPHRIMGAAATPVLGPCPKELEVRAQTDTCILCSHCWRRAPTQQLSTYAGGHALGHASNQRTTGDRREHRGQSQKQEAECCLPQARGGDSLWVSKSHRFSLRTGEVLVKGADSLVTTRMCLLSLTCAERHRQRGAFYTVCIAAYLHAHRGRGCRHRTKSLRDNL